MIPSSNSTSPISATPIVPTSSVAPALNPLYDSTLTSANTPQQSLQPTLFSLEALYNQLIGNSPLPHLSQVFYHLRVMETNLQYQVKEEQIKRLFVHLENAAKALEYWPSELDVDTGNLALWESVANNYLIRKAKIPFFDKIDTQALLAMHDLITKERQLGHLANFLRYLDTVIPNLKAQTTEAKIERLFETLQKAAETHQLWNSNLAWNVRRGDLCLWEHMACELETLIDEKNQQIVLNQLAKKIPTLKKELKQGERNIIQAKRDLPVANGILKIADLKPLFSIEDLKTSYTSMGSVAALLPRIINAHILSLVEQNLSVLPKEVAQMTGDKVRLETLNVRNNHLQEIPADMKDLITFNGSDNHFAKFPDLKTCVNLQNIFLDNNQIKEIPDYLKDRKVQKLCLSNNLIDTIPDWLTIDWIKKSSLIKFHIEGNPVSKNTVLIEQIKQAIKARKGELKKEAKDCKKGGTASFTLGSR